MPEEAQVDALFKWVAILTGSKNALKGVGFFLGAAAADSGRASRPSLLILAGWRC